MKPDKKKRRTAGNSGKLYLFLKPAKTGPIQLRPKEIDVKTTKRPITWSSQSTKIP